MLYTTSLARILVAALLLVVPSAVHSADLYRYTNNEGNMVVAYRVPPEYAAKGYEVLNEEGIVMQVVPRELTDEERAQQDIVEQMAIAAAAEDERLRKWDESLLLRYSTIEDIEAARERALRDLRIRVSILKSNTRSLKQQVENYQTVAANVERGGGTVSVQSLTTIEDLQAEIGVTERSIVDRQQEVAQVQQGFQTDIDRFDQLLEVVDFRRALLARDRD